MTEFILNNTHIKTSEPAGMALLDFIRKKRHLTGMKLVCKEGECGACTVLVGNEQGDKIVYQSMTSCIMPLANAQGKHIVTIEGLNMDKLTPVQEAMVATNGTQCGFCTPGFVVSLTGALLSGQSISESYILENIDGNICRCTGYKSIERAAKSIYESLNGSTKMSIADLVQQGYIPAYFEDILSRLNKIPQPATIAESANMRVGGGTDLYVQKPYKMYAADVLPLYDNPALKTIEIIDNQCIFGASMTMGDLYRSELFNQALPHSEYVFKLLSSTQIRNMATIGGNLINASPIGDFTIWLLSLDSEIVLNNKGSRRTLQLKYFYLDYKKMDLQPGEILEQIRFDIPPANAHVHFEKVSQRKYLDIAGVNSGSWIELAADNTITTIHLSAGGVGPIPMYLHKTCGYLQGKVMNEATLEAAIEVLNDEVSPISDARGSAQYKRLLLRQLFLAHFLQIDPEIFQLQKLIKM